MSSFFFFFKQKTAYEMRISDWSSDVCSSDLDYLKILAEPVELAQMPLDGEPLVLRHDLLDQPDPALRPAEVGGRAGRNQMRVQDRLNDVLQPGSLPDDLVAARDLPAPCLGRSEEHTSELQPLMRTSYAVFCLKKK